MRVFEGHKVGHCVLKASKSQAVNRRYWSPPDEGKAFRQFVARLQGQEQVAKAVASPIVSSVPDEKNELPEIAPVEIAGLQLEPLLWENLRDGKKIKIESLCNVITCQTYREGR